MIRIWRWWKFRQIRRQHSNGYREALFLPTCHLDDLSEELYRAHCEEILVRLEYGDELNSPTDAEIVGYLGKKYSRMLLTDTEKVLFINLSEQILPNVSMPIEHELDEAADKRYEELQELLRVERRIT